MFISRRKIEIVIRTEVVTTPNGRYMECSIKRGDRQETHLYAHISKASEARLAALIDRLKAKAGNKDAPRVLGALPVCRIVLRKDSIFDSD